MGDPITYGGVVVTVFFVVLSLRAEKWWPVFYAPAVLFWFSTGVLAWSWPESMRDVWWSAWLLYAFALPIFRVSIARRAREAERLGCWADVLREGANVDSDDHYIYILNSKGERIHAIERHLGVLDGPR